MRAHTVILGAGATIAAIPKGDKNGMKSSVMTGLINNLHLEDILNGIELNTKSDYCHECGYDGEMKINSNDMTWYCPNCGNTNQDTMNIARRTCGRPRLF